MSTSWRGSGSRGLGWRGPGPAASPDARGGWFRLGVWITGLMVVLGLLHAAGGGLLAAPPVLDPAALDRWVSQRDAVIIVAAVARVGVLGLGWYLLVSTVALALARSAHAVRAARLAEALALPSVRRLVHGALGVGLAAAVVAAPATPAAAAYDEAPRLAVSADGGLPPPGAPFDDAVWPHAERSQGASGPTTEPRPPSSGARTDRDTAGVSGSEHGRDTSAPAPGGTSRDAAIPARGPWWEAGALDTTSPRTPWGPAMAPGSFDSGLQAPESRAAGDVSAPTGGASDRPAGERDLEEIHDSEGRRAAEAGGPSVAEVDGPRGGEATWEVSPGDHLWGVAEATLAAEWDRMPNDREIAIYLDTLIEDNHSVLPDPTNPDLVHPGIELRLPPVPEAGAS